MRNYTGILGGTFNPVHIGHIRLGIECAERFDLQGLELMPCLVPPHKGAKGILPFALRVQALQAALEGHNLVRVSTLEGELKPPSYSWNSLRAWKERHPDKKGLFVLGAEDFAAMASWHRGLELPGVMDMLVIARRDAGKESFLSTLKALWPEARLENKGECAHMPHGTRCLFAAMPLLDISASMIREKWLQGLSLDYLLPPGAAGVLETHKALVRAAWSGVEAEGD